MPAPSEFSDKIFLDQVRDYYSDRLKRFGAVPQGVDWGTDQRQMTRFQQLGASFANDDNFSLLDLGCGYGAFCGYLEARGKHVDYAGTDLSEDMVSAARSLYPKHRFEVGGLGDEPFDYVLASGIFNVMRAASPLDWEAYVHQSLKAMFSRARKAIAVNFLTAHSDPERRSDNLYYADPGAMLEFCIRNLSRDFTLSHHYGIWDFTIIVRQEIP
jgi:SAM-dependent methyltransferase